MLKYLAFFLLYVSTLTATTVVFIGDEISCGYGLEPEYCYVNQLEQRLKDEGKDICIINCSFEGAKTDTLNQVAIEVIERHRPDYIFVLLGKNDVKESVPSETIKNNFMDMIATCHGFTKIVIGKIEANSKLKDVYAYIEINSDVFSVYLLDKYVNRHLQKSFYPNATGHFIMADIVYNALDTVGAYE